MFSVAFSMLMPIANVVGFVLVPVPLTVAVAVTCIGPQGGAGGVG
jgi:hypothetical protein